MIYRFSPENFSVMEFRSEWDYKLCSRIRGEHSLIQTLGFRLSTELHMTNDNHLFRKLGGKPYHRPIASFEGKMIHQFDPNFSTANYAVDEAEAREVFLRKRTLPAE